MASSGNFLTMNPLNKGTPALLSGNCKLNMATDNTGALGNIEIPLTGKWYFECFAQMGSGVEGYVGVSDIETDLTSSRGGITDSNMYGFGFSQYSGSNYFAIKVTAGTADTDGKIDTGSTNNAVLGIAVNRDDNEIKLYTNNTLRFTIAISATTLYFPFFGVGGAANASFFMYLNAGQDSTFGGNKTAGGNADGNGFGDFFYSPVSGHVALSSANLPISADIDPAGEDGETENPDKHAGAVLYTGNGGSPDLVVSGLGFKPDLVWGKARGASQLPILQDSARGQELLFSSSTNAAQTSNGPFMVSFNDDGFTYDGSGSNPNDGSVTYVAWCFRANGGTATATISESGNNPAASVQANPKGGFSIITYTGTGGAGTIAHGLDSAPTFMIMKNRGVADPWAVYHIGTDASAPATKYLVLNTNAAVADDATYWNDTAPTSSVLTVGTNHSVNADGENYVAYVWAPVKGGSKFGSFEGNADDDGTFVYTGFRPKIIFIKENDTADDWCVYDTARSTFNPVQKVVRWENAVAEYDNSARAIDILSNGFKIRTSNNTINQASTFVYGAWGDVPFKYNNTF